jgi:hypothetical protein
MKLHNHTKIISFLEAGDGSKPDIDSKVKEIMN